MAYGQHLRLDPYTGPWAEEIWTGCWLRLDTYLIPIKPGFRHVGLVRGARG